MHRVGSGAGSRWQSSAGGLVTALAPVLQSMPGVWVGWSGNETTIRPFTHDGMRIRPVALSRKAVDQFYNGMSNKTFWPLYHDAIRAPEFRSDWWERYQSVNQRFARAAATEARPGDLVWVHDYHLQLVPAMLRKLRPDLRIGFFLHIPFPPEELFEWLPWRREVLEGLLGSDVVGFHTRSTARNFAQLCRRYAGATGTDTELRFEGRRVVCDAFPISIDTAWFEERARKPEIEQKAQDLRRRLGDKRTVYLSIDRLDYTKGILHRLRAYEQLLERGLATLDSCVLVQIATPSRDSVDDYAKLREEVEREVGRINGRFSEPGRVALHYLRRNLTREELVAYYRAADVMLVTPLRDGMNLVAKEYVACRPDGTGVLVLSEFAGAAQELSRALLVNPRDLDGFVHALHQARTMPLAEQRARMAWLRARVRRNNVFAWCNRYITSLRQGTSPPAISSANFPANEPATRPHSGEPVVAPGPHEVTHAQPLPARTH